MIAALKKVFQHDDKPLNKAITANVSQAKQQNEAAVNRLNHVLCEVLDGPGCDCRGLKVVNL